MVTRYEITVTGGTGPMLLAALPEFESLPDLDGCVRLAGPVQDQAALHGLLHRLYALHVELIAVQRVTNETLRARDDA